MNSSLVLGRTSEFRTQLQRSGQTIHLRATVLRSITWSVASTGNIRYFRQSSRCDTYYCDKAVQSDRLSSVRAGAAASWLRRGLKLQRYRPNPGGPGPSLDHEAFCYEPSVWPWSLLSWAYLNTRHILMFIEHISSRPMGVWEHPSCCEPTFRKFMRTSHQKAKLNLQRKTGPIPDPLYLSLKLAKALLLLSLYFLLYFSKYIYSGHS